jgi:hypothetical protein
MANQIGKDLGTGGMAQPQSGVFQVQTANVADNAVTNAKLANMTQATVKGRASGAGTGDPQDLTTAQLTALVEPAVAGVQAGTMSSTDKTKLTNLDYNGWFTDRVTEMKAAIPELTDFEYVKIGRFGLGTTSAPSVFQDGAVEGGGTAGSASIWYFGNTVCQTPATGKFAFVIRLKASANLAGSSAVFGLANNAGTHKHYVGFNGSIDTAKFIMALIGAGATTVTGSVNANTSWNNLMMTFNGGTISFYVNGVLAGSTSDMTNVTDEAMALFIQGVQAFGTKIAYGYIAP